MSLPTIVPLFDQATSSKETGHLRVFYWRILAAWWVLSVVLSIAKPFQTQVIRPYPLLLVYWVIVVGVSLFGGRLLRSATRRVMARRPEWQIEIASIVVLVSVLTFVIRIGSPVIVGEQASQDMPDTSVLALYVISIAVPVAVLRQIWTSISTATAQSLESAPRLLLRLPEDARAPVLRLSSRDHQVEVVTRLGAELIRMRLADAIAEMEPVPGYGTHRSHWVAAAAIEGVEQDGNRTFLLLVNGDRVPVGKKYRPGLENMGVL